MPMIKFYSFEEDGVLEQLEWQPHYWINVERPDADDYRFVESLGVPESFMENVADMDERPRFEHENGWLLTIVRVPVHDDKDPLEYSTVPMGIMTKDDIIVTVCHKSTSMIPDFIDHTHKRHITIENQPDFVLRMIFSSTYWFLVYLKKINDTVVSFTEELERSVRNELLLSLMKLQKALVYFNTSLQGNNMLTERVNEVFAEDCDMDLLGDVEIELRQACNTVNVYMEILSNSLDTFASVISNNVNDKMKTMTSVTIILMVPTLVASFYGMNVGVWFGTARYSFGCIILVSFLLAGIVWYWLKRVKWL